MSHVSHVWRLTHNYTHMMGGRGKVLSIGHAVCGGDLEEGGVWIHTCTCEAFEDQFPAITIAHGRKRHP